MKLEEMADVLDGLALTLEKFLGKTAVSDFHALGDCLRKFPGETVAAFCNFTVQARAGRSAAPRGAGKANEAKVQELVARIQHFLDNRRDCDYAAIRQSSPTPPSSSCPTSKPSPSASTITSPAAPRLRW